MQPAIVITGASSGIGAEFARLPVEPNVVTVLVARSRPELEALAGEIEATGRRVEVICADLSERNIGETIARELEDRQLFCDIFVNNAGYGLFGDAADLDREHQLGIIDVNIRAGIDLVLHFLPGMIARGRGKILNLSSVAGFVPGGPRMAVYFASKAFLLSFSLALSHETRGTGVTVTCLCPGGLRTPFLARAGASQAALFKIFPKLHANAVARIGWDAMHAGQMLCVPGFYNKLAVMITRLLPRRMLLALTDVLQRDRHAG